LLWLTLESWSKPVCHDTNFVIAFSITEWQKLCTELSVCVEDWHRSVCTLCVCVHAPRHVYSVCACVCAQPGVCELCVCIVHMVLCIMCEQMRERLEFLSWTVGTLFFSFFFFLMHYYYIPAI
jgi:hypothetical protein